MPSTVLASLIQQSINLNKYDTSILNFQNTKITQIGLIPNQIIPLVKTLILKNNHLRSIEGIQQFKVLQILDLSQNKISSGTFILNLKCLKNLKKILLQGNPFLQNPLTEQLITFLSSFDNDLQILNFAFVNEDRQNLVHQYRKNKSQSRISSQFQLKKTASQQQFDNLPKNIQVSKLVQRSKVNMLLSSMKQFIEQKQQSQQISNQSVDGESQFSKSLIIQHQQPQLIRQHTNQITPIKKSPKFGSYFVEQKTFSETNQTSKYHDESTNVKAKKFIKQKIMELESPYASNGQSRYLINDKFLEEKSSRNESLSKQLKKSAQKQFKYQVDNLKIKMQMDSVALNYPSIIEKQDQDSYEIEFDFMSASKQSRLRKKQMSPSQKSSPYNQLKEISKSIVKIQDDQANQRHKIYKKKQQFGKKPVYTQRPQISPRVLSSSLNKIYQQQMQQKLLFEKLDKQNDLDNKQSIKEQPILGKKGSLQESTRYLVPKTNKSTTEQIINKLLYNKNINESISFSVGTSLNQMMQNGQKFEKFYYNSLTRLKPTFNLLYSPFSSLKTEQKDMLLQELFKNHKQIFILFMRQFHQKQKLNEQVRIKNELISRLNEQMQNYKQELNNSNHDNMCQEQQLKVLRIQNVRYKKQQNKFEQILKSRQKIINDVRLQYEKVNKLVDKKQNMIKKLMKQDEIQEQIQNMHQMNIKSRYLGIINNKGNKMMRINEFRKRIQMRRQQQQWRDNNQMKKNIINQLLNNLCRYKQIKRMIRQKNRKIILQVFNEWKILSKLDRLSLSIQNKIMRQREKQCINILFRYNCNRKRLYKINNIVRIKLLRKSFYNVLINNYQQSIQHKKQLLTKAQSFYHNKLLNKYYYQLKSYKNQNQSLLSSKSKIIQSIIIQHQLYLFNQIIHYQQSLQIKHIQHIQYNIIKHKQTILFIKLLTNNYNHQIKHRTNLSLSNNFKLKYIFLSIKQITINNINKYQQFSPLIRKIAHQHKLQLLIIKFKQNNLTLNINKKRKQSLFTSFQSFHLNKNYYTHKSNDLINYLNFGKVFKAKHNFISYLRQLNILRKMKNKQLNLSEHYHIQQGKYKQSYQLNMLTMDQLKSQINTYLNQLQFYKIQVQKLSQRQLYILQEKQHCLIQMQCKDQQNFELKRALTQNQNKIIQLQKKYQKSLDMYAAAMDQVTQQQIKLANEKTTFLYDTITGSRSPATFRRQANETKFTSLKR